MSRVVFRVGPAVLLLGGALAWASSCGVTNQDCTKEYQYDDREDDCPYGPPGGPQLKKTSRDCPLIEVNEADPACADATYMGHVVPIFEDATRGNCTAAGCHGQIASGGLLLPAGDPAAMYEAMTLYVDERGDPYVGVDADVARSWLHCNVAGLIGGGDVMPPPNGLQDDAAVVQKWLECGGKMDGSAGPGGAGGAAAGGMGGVGGLAAGGAGGVGGL